MSAPDDVRRLLLVHAHPDDESITTGATMARYAAEGVQVTLVTCTLGEKGEVIPSEMADLADDPARLAARRQDELAAAMAQLGVTDHRLLGGPGRYRDSGMLWGETGRRAVAPERIEPGSFWAADLRDAADDLVPVLREVRPHVVVTYDDNGGYGHPDHVQAHRVTTYAVALSAVASYRPDLGAPWPVPKVYWTAMPRSLVQRGIDALRETATPHDNLGSPDDLGYVVADDLVDAVVDGSAYLDRKIAAMRAHATQMTVGEGFFALSDNVGQRISGVEHYRLAQGRDHGPGRPVADLFAGIGV